MSIRSFFGFGKGRKSQSQSSKRALRMEALEERALLSAAPLSTSEYADLCDQYAEFNLPANMNDLNVITLDLAQGDGLSQLKSAISTAGTTTKSDLIVVRTSNSANTLTYTAAGNELTININTSQYGSVTIVGLGSNSFTLDANQICRVMSISGSSTANLGGLTIKNGNASSNNAGGGIYISNSRLQIANSSIIGNTADAGGGIYSYSSTINVTGSEISGNSSLGTGTFLNHYLGGGGIMVQYGSTIVINSCKIVNNSALGKNGEGGGISTYYYDEGSVYERPTNLTINDSTISNNTSSADGGGICNDLWSYLTITNSNISSNKAGIFNGNSSAFGGGIINRHRAIITNCTISGNSSDGYGGGVHNSQYSKLTEALTINNCTITGNTTWLYGGGISSRSTMTVSNSKITNNTANHYDSETGYYAGGGGGIDDSDGDSSFINCIITDNSAANGGGILSNAHVDSPTVIVNCTIARNTAMYHGGGIQANKGVKFFNSIIVSNTSEEGSDVYKCYENSEITGYNNLSSFTGWSGSGNITHDGTKVNFVNFAKGDYRLAAGSQAIDKGSNTYANNAGLTSASKDLSGNRRFDGTIDIGAYEYQKNVTYSTVVTTLEDSFDLYDDEWSLREAISYAPVYCGADEYPEITFAEGLEGEIILTRGELTIQKALSIDGDNRITIDGNNKNRVLYTGAGTAEKPVVLNGLTIQNGYTDNGGGIYNAGALTVSSCTISDNSSSINGGGIYSKNGDIKIINSVISGNTSNYGGGVYALGNTFIVSNSRISRNTAKTDGGGIRTIQCVATVTNSSISENIAKSGGGIHNYNDTTLIITNSTITRNIAINNQGSGIYNANNSTGSVKVNNSIVIGNVNGNSTSDIYSPNVAVNGSNNLTTYRSWNGSGNIYYNESNPPFVDADNGNYHLASGSQAINAGSNALAVDANGAALVNDLDNRSRIVYGVVDIGAYEYHAPLASPTLTVSAAGSDSISVTVGEAANAAGYTVEYSTSEDFTNAVSQNVSAGVTTISGLTAETTYYFRALALGTGDYGDSAYSEIQSATTDPDTIQLASPTLSASATGSNSVSVTVGSVANASGYRVEYSTSADFANAVSQNVNAGKTTISGLTAETTYYFRALAIGSGDYGDSDFSATATATTLAEPVAADAKVNARIVFQDSLKDADTAAELPEGITSIRATKTVYAEIWVKDVEDTDPAIVGGYVNMLYDSDALNVLDVTYGTVFCYMTGFQTYENGEIATIGGTTAPSVLDKGDDEWVRLATVSFVADTEGLTTVSLGAPNASYYNLTRTDTITLSNAQIDYGSAELEITAACPMDIDGDGYIAVSDYALLSRAWLSNSTSPNWNPACDIDGDGFVAVSDYAYLSRNWLKSVNDPDLYYPGASASPAAPVSENVVIASPAAVVSEDNLIEMNNTAALEADETANVCLTAVSTKTASDTADEVPSSLTEINPGDSFFVEIWIRNFNGYEGTTLCGLTGGYLNMSYPSDLLSVGNVTYGSVYSILNNIQNVSTAGIIDTIGGVAATSVMDKGDDEWVRLATVSFTATDNGDALIESLPPAIPPYNLTLTSGRTLKNDEISFGVINLKIGSTVIQLKVNNDFIKTTLNNSVVIAYRENDAVADWSKTTVEFGDASNGEYSVNGNGTITYTPEDGFYGTDAVSYVVVDSTGELSTGAIVISVGLPIATSVQKTSGSHSPSSAMAASVERLTDWDNCCVELWAQDVNALNPGETTFTLSYNPTIYNAPYFSACADGVALSVTDSAALPDGSVEVQLTARVLESLSSQTDNLFLGTVVLTPSMDDGSGVVAPLAAEPVCALDGSATPTTVEAMPYDLIRNGSVDVNDFVAFATVFGYVPGNMSPINPLYVQTAKSDFNKDGSVNADDFVLFAINFGATKNTADKPAPLASAASELRVASNELREGVLKSECKTALPLVEQLPSSNYSQLKAEAYSAALLDLYDNQDVADLSGSSDVLAKSRLDAQLFDVESDSSCKASSQAIDAVLEEDLLAIDWN